MFQLVTKWTITLGTDALITGTAIASIGTNATLTSAYRCSQSCRWGGTLTARTAASFSNDCIAHCRRCTNVTLATAAGAHIIQATSATSFTLATDTPSYAGVGSLAD